MLINCQHVKSFSNILGYITQEQAWAYSSFLQTFHFFKTTKAAAYWYQAIKLYQNA